MKISKIIKSATIVTILGFGTAFTASADGCVDIFDVTGICDHGPSVGPLINTMGSGLLVAISRNPSLRDELYCIHVANYRAVTEKLTADELADELALCPEQAEE